MSEKGQQIWKVVRWCACTQVTKHRKLDEEMGQSCSGVQLTYLVCQQKCVCAAVCHMVLATNQVAICEDVNWTGGVRYLSMYMNEALVRRSAGLCRAFVVLEVGIGALLPIGYRIEVEVV